MFHKGNEKRKQYLSGRFISGILILGIAVSFFFTSVMLSGCQSRSPEAQNEAFQKFTQEVFCEEVTSNTISVHYSLKNPKNYGIEEIPVTFGAYETDKEKICTSVDLVRQAMEKFDYNKLTRENRLTWDVLKYYLDSAVKGAEYLLYDEPLGLVGGIQTQLPVLLSEYTFYDKEDVELYLELLKTTPEYFESLTAFEQKKSEAGLFMSDTAADQVIEQCDAFKNMGESNYLISTFVERLKEVPDLTEKEKSDYIKKNALYLNSYVLPAYSKLTSAVQKLKGTGKNEGGLCGFEKGKEYYEQLVQFNVGTERTVSEIKTMTREQILSDLEAMEQVLGISRNDVLDETEAQEVAAMEEENPVSILNFLEANINEAFPKLPKTNVQVKYVPEALEEHLSPAFYMIPAVDNYTENVIYVNQSCMGNTLNLFTTLAHEGYPGHLYQTVYFANTNPDPLRTVFGFGGYVEGWATYAEMCSYYLAPLEKIQAVILQKNSSIILGLYTLADIGIHAEGWSRIDTAAFFANYGIKDTDTINRIYDLIIGCPGNYLKYYVGYLEFMELKKQWIQKEGSDFSQKEFHEAVLSVGPAPFEIVEKYMWEDK